MRVRAARADACLPRPRLVELLEQRWEHPVMVLSGPAGLGKSTAVQQAVTPGDGHDVVVPLRRTHRDPLRLAHALLAALGGEHPLVGDDPSELAEVVASVLADGGRRCLVLDDVDVLGPDGLSVIAELAGTLGPASHLLLAGRRMDPILRLGHLRAAGLVVDVGPEELCFTEAERAALALRHGRDPACIGDLGGWPALCTLQLRSGREAVWSYVEEEVVAALGRDGRRALAAAALLGRVGDGDLRAAGVTVRVRDLVHRVPLVALDTDGQATSHPFWAQVPLVDAETERDLRVDLAARRAELGGIDEAIDLLAAAQAWDEAARVVLGALRDGDELVARDDADRWLRAFPVGERGRPELLVLRGLVARLELGPHHGDALLRSAAAAFRDAGDHEGHAVAVVQQIARAWHECDGPALAELHEEALAIHEADPAAIGVHATVIGALRLDLDGRTGDALRLLDDIRDPVVSLAPATRIFIELARCGLALVVGEGAQALAAVGAAEAASSGRAAAAISPQRAVAAWLSGDPGPALALHRADGSDAPRTARDRARGDVYINAFAASLGLAQPVDVAALESEMVDNGRDRTFIAMAAAASAAARGEDGEAARLIRTSLARHGLDDPLVMGELRRFLPVAYVVAPELRPALAEGDLGPTHRRSLALARVLVAVREGGEPRWDDVADPEATVAWLPLPWAAELAVGAVAAGRPEGAALASRLDELAGEPLRRSLERLAVDDRSGAASALLVGLGAGPRAAVSIGVLGPLEVSHGGAPEAVSRRRVRELLALLTVWPVLSRDRAMDLLWPELGVDRARNNLNVTLGHLRRAIDPERGEGATGELLLSGSDRIQLVRDGRVEVDLWRARALVAEADDHARSGRRTAARLAYQQVAELWRGEPLGELVDVGAAHAERAEVGALVLDATRRAAELARDDADGVAARRWAAKVLAVDPLDERAHVVVIGSALDEGDSATARQAASACLAALAAEGVGPGPVLAAVVASAGSSGVV